MKQCSRCKEDKPVEEFYPHSGRVDGRRSDCKACAREYEARPEVKARRRVYACEYNARPDVVDRKRELNRVYRLISVYGLAPEGYARLLESQGGRCAICGTDTPGGHGGFHVDHDHATGEVRGLLCKTCNTLLGNAKDSPFVLESAIRYLAAPPASSVLASQEAA